jgi:hypothetical protein
MAIDWDLFKYGKPAARSKVKARADRDFDKAREACRAEVYDRAGRCCERCGLPLKLKPSEARSEFEIANINEEPKRSRGGDPTNPADCVCLCCRCHNLITDNLIRIVWIDPMKKAFGGARFEDAA